MQAKLAACWTSFMFLYVYVGILVLYHKPGVIEDILAGTVWEFQITQTWATVALALMSTPIAMMTLSVVLALGFEGLELPVGLLTPRSIWHGLA